MAEQLLVCCNSIFTGTNDACFDGAFLIEDGRIAYVGTRDDVRAQAGDVQEVDFGDAFVCPGFHDSHLHFFHSALYSSPLAMRYRGTSEQDCVNALAELAARRPGDGWLLCQGWRESHWTPARTPSKHSLDAAYPTRPVAMYSGDAHTLWLNSTALDALGIGRDSTDPEGGSYDRDEHGELTGIVREAAAMELMPRIVASFTPQELEDAYRGFLASCASKGITSVCDMSLMAAPGLDFVRDDLFESLLAQGDLTCRVHLFPTLLDDLSRFEDMRARLNGDVLRACGLKQFFDGVSSQHTAWVDKPYTNARFDGDCGRPTVDPAVMRRMVMAAHEHGYPVRIHTIGDAAIHEALDIYADAQERFGNLPAQQHHCLEHLENFQPDDIARMGAQGVVAACQPMHITLDPGAPELDLGEERVKYMWPFATLLNTGAVLAFGTDSPVCDVDPLPGLYTAVTRKTIPGGLPESGWVPDERITMAQALRAYTLGSAMACGRASELGTLEVGKFADFVVLDRNLLACDEEQILDAKVQATYLAGKQTY